MASLSFRRYLWSRNFWLSGFLFFLPMLMTGILIVHEVWKNNWQQVPFNQGYVIKIFEQLFSGGFLHFGVIFVALGFSNSVIREELEEQTLHYLFLQPIPRWGIMVGKLVGFCMFAFPMMAIGLIAMHVVALSGMRGGLTTLYFTPDRILTTLAEIMVLFTAFLMYAAVFLAMGSFFKNVGFGLYVYAWELASGMLPQTLKYFSVVYYLKSLLPYRSGTKPGFIAIPMEPASDLVSILMLTAIFGVCGAVSWLMARQRQCLYGSGS